MKPSHIAWRIRPFGWFLLVGGCVLLTVCFLSVSSLTHPMWIWQSQHLSTEEMIPRTEAVAAMREFQLKANWLFRKMIFLPTVAMFLGGLILGISTKKN
jgi:hypothetical protein